MKICTPEFFGVKFNPVKSINGIIKVGIQYYILNHCKVMSIEPVKDTESTG